MRDVGAGYWGPRKVVYLDFIAGHNSRPGDLLDAWLIPDSADDGEWVT